jgi:hypothetical protein
VAKIQIIQQLFRPGRNRKYKKTRALEPFLKEIVINEISYMVR